MNENELYVVKEYKFDNSLITDIDFKIDKCFRDCYKNYFHNFKYDCMYGIKLTIITNIETINLIFSDKSMNLYEINKKLTAARQNGFIFNQIKKTNNKILFTLTIYKHKLLSKVSNTDVS